MRWAVLARFLVGAAVLFTGLTGTGPWTASAGAGPLPPNSAVSFNVAHGLASQVVTATMTLSNPNAATILTGIATQFVISNGAAFASPANLSNSCGGSVNANSGDSIASVSGASLASGASCTINVDVQLPPSPGFTSLYNRNSNGATANESGSAKGTDAYAALSISVPPSVAAAFSPTSITAAQTSTLTLTITNPNQYTGSDQLTGIALAASALPANLTLAGGGNSTNSCTNSTFNAGTLSLSGVTLDAHSSCTVTVQVTSSVAAGYSYTTGVVSATGPLTLTGTKATTATPLTVTALSPPNAALSYIYSGTPIAGQVVKGQLVLTNPNPAALTGIAVSIHNSNGASFPSPDNLVNGCGGSVNVGNGPNGLVVSGASLPGLGSCTLTVDIRLPSSAGFTSIDTNTQAATATESGSASGTQGYATLNFYNLLTTTQAVGQLNFYQGVAINSVIPVAAGGGAPAITLGISPALPTGLQFDTSTGAITGTATSTSATKTYTVTATDQSNPSQNSSKTFDLTVNAAVTAAQTVPAKILTQNYAATAFVPVTGGGGAAPLTYSISPSLPSGVSISPTTGGISGAPSAAGGAVTYTVTVTDALGAQASNTFQMAVNSAVTATQAVGATDLTQNHAATPFIPVTGSGGLAPLTYSVSPALPTGLSFGSSTGQISGTPTIPSTGSSYSVTVTDANGATATNIFTLTVNGAVTATQAVSTTILTQNHAATSFTPVTGAGGTSPLSYGVSPPLPAGLSFDTSNGQISGTPSTASAAGTYTVTVTDAQGATATATFGLAVTSGVTATQAVATTILTENHAATSFTPVTGSGGAGSLTYGVSPGLPAGLNFNTANGQVTGTPSVTSAATTYTVTVTDANAATASSTFSLAVESAVTATQAVATKSLTVTTPVTPFTPVTGGGGTSPLSYGVLPALPAGLSFGTTNGLVSGTPTVVSAAASYEVTVTDANGATATNSFSLKVDSIGQTITFTSTPPSPVHVHSPDYLVSATGGASGEPVLFSIDASSGVGVCSISGSTVSFLSAAGSCVVNANQAGNAQYAAAQQAQQTITVLTTDVGAVTKAIGGFISDRANQIVSNQADFGRHGMDRLNEAAGQNGGGSSGSTNQEVVATPKSDLPLSAFGSHAGAGGTLIPIAAMAYQATGGLQDAYGLQATLLGAVQNAGQSGSMDRLSYSGAFDATLNAHDGFAASFHGSLSQFRKWQDAVLGVNGSQGGGSHSYSPFDLWAEGIYAGYNGERTGQFGLFTAGADYVINPNLLIGAFTQVDAMKQTSGTTISGTGWMAGPYATVRLTDQMFWTLRAGWGRSGNSLPESGDFTSTRWLASTEVAGKWTLGQGVTFTPNLGFTYFQDTTDAYKDTFGVTIPGVKTELGQLKFSPELSYGFATDGGLWVEPSLTPELIWNFASTNVDGLGALSDTATGPTGLRGRIKAGLDFRTQGGVAMATAISYDGIGATGYSAIAAQARINVPLN
ncbi:putative Ig domain-containing protein [Mesorhizobium sp.]|uniref:putative Ig domain-containing protein n=1 Tax=Mesorhizobium sp. TaxID=1871066 RepID=UPI003BA8EC6F